MEYSEYLVEAHKNSSDYIKMMKKIDPTFDNARLLFMHLKTVHDWLDEEGVVRTDEDGVRLSLVGRIIEYKAQGNNKE